MKQPAFPFQTFYSTREAEKGVRGHRGWVKIGRNRNRALTSLTGEIQRPPSPDFFSLLGSLAKWGAPLANVGLRIRGLTMTERVCSIANTFIKIGMREAWEKGCDIEQAGSGYKVMGVLSFRWSCCSRSGRVSLWLVSERQDIFLVSWDPSRPQLALWKKSHKSKKKKNPPPPTHTQKPKHLHQKEKSSRCEESEESILGVMQSYKYGRVFAAFVDIEHI